MPIFEELLNKKNPNYSLKSFLDDYFKEELERMLNELEMKLQDTLGTKKQIDTFMPSGKFSEEMKRMVKNTIQGEVRAFLENQKNDIHELIKKESNREFFEMLSPRRIVQEETKKIIGAEIQIRFGDIIDELKRIKAEKGERGDLGIQGIQGEQGEQGIQGIQGVQGEKGDNGYSDTPEEIIEKVNTTQESVNMKVIKGLSSFLTNLQKMIKDKRVSGGGGMGNAQHQTLSGDGSATSFTLNSSVAGNGTAIWVYYQGQHLVRTTHYTISGTTISFTFTPENNTSIDITWIRG